MNKLMLFTLISVFLLSSITLYGEPKRAKRCAKMVLLPGQKKPIKCRKARNLKNNYF
jgi:hypothetical protein